MSEARSDVAAATNKPQPIPVLASKGLFLDLVMGPWPSCRGKGSVPQKVVPRLSHARVPLWPQNLEPLGPVPVASAPQRGHVTLVDFPALNTEWVCGWVTRGWSLSPAARLLPPQGTASWRT